jgi:hypothetical protein
MKGTSHLKMLFAGSIGISLAGFLWAGDIDIGNEDVQGPAGQVYNNYTFKVDTIGRLLMEPGVHQFGSNLAGTRRRVLQIEPQNVPGAQVAILRTDPGQGINNT